MLQLLVKLENCYGINKLTHNFGFKKKNCCLIYASNGTMKTSFAKTFLDISNGTKPSDEIYEKTPICNITKLEKNAPRSVNIDPEDIFVIESFKDNFNFENISTLLVNKPLQEEHARISIEIEKEEKDFIKRISKISKLKQNEVQKIIVNDFSELNMGFLDILLELESQIDGTVDFDVTNIKYSTLFDPKVLKFLEQDNILGIIEKYATKYMELIDQSDIFERNLFTHNHASNVNQQLIKNNFFRANHEIKLRNGQLINNNEDLEAVINKQKEDILSDEELTGWFNDIDSALDKNDSLRDFKSLLSNYPNIIIPQLNNIPEFKKLMWISILNEENESYLKLNDLYKSNKADLETIFQQANNEESLWKDVVKLFNKRFLVPFRLEVSNQADVILNDTIPTIKFIYESSDESKEMNQDELLRVLSTGEKRALYLLNILYEIEIRIKSRRKTFIITDDIADSFDYQNKYAIVEYLNDIMQEEFFYLIILTHNFDFYRTVGSRLGIQGNSYVISKDEHKIHLTKGGEFFGNIFQNWKESLDNVENIDNRRFIASIPFVRNLSEYYGNDDDFNLLTQLLHIKDRTKSMKLEELKDVYKKNWNLDLISNREETIYNIILKEADDLLTENNDDLILENKIVLSIAIRLLAEEYMISKITNQPQIEAISEFQTRLLFNEFKKEYQNDDNFETIMKNLEQVNIMTPENIHLNSFMYEPILDTPDHHLRELYENIVEANNAGNTT